MENHDKWHKFPLEAMYGRHSQHVRPKNYDLYMLVGGTHVILINDHLQMQNLLFCDDLHIFTIYQTKERITFLNSLFCYKLYISPVSSYQMTNNNFNPKKFNDPNILEHPIEELSLPPKFCLVEKFELGQHLKSIHL
jgi:hypothetical protein